MASTATIERASVIAAPQHALHQTTPILTTGGGFQNSLAADNPTSHHAATTQYYALHVTPGHESTMARHIARLAGDSLTDVFQLSAELERKRAGMWRLEQEVLYPGYLFLHISNMQDFQQAIKLSTSYSRLLAVGDTAAPLTQEEADLVAVMGGKRHVIGMSVGVIQDGMLSITEGPLKHREHQIKDVNRRKRLAWLGTGFTRGGVTRLGLDIVSKT